MESQFNLLKAFFCCSEKLDISILFFGVVVGTTAGTAAGVVEFPQFTAWFTVFVALSANFLAFSAASSRLDTPSLHIIFSILLMAPAPKSIPSHPKNPPFWNALYTPYIRAAPIPRVAIGSPFPRDIISPIPVTRPLVASPTTPVT